VHGGGYELREGMCAWTCVWANLNMLPHAHSGTRPRLSWASTRLTLEIQLTISQYAISCKVTSHCCQVRVSTKAISVRFTSQSYVQSALSLITVFPNIGFALQINSISEV
jgi:hypothetical protein